MTYVSSVVVGRVVISLFCRLEAKGSNPSGNNSFISTCISIHTGQNSRELLQKKGAKTPFGPGWILDWWARSWAGPLDVMYWIKISHEEWCIVTRKLKWALGSNMGQAQRRWALLDGPAHASAWEKNLNTLDRRSKPPIY